MFVNEISDENIKKYLNKIAPDLKIINIIRDDKISPYSLKNQIIVLCVSDKRKEKELILKNFEIESYGIGENIRDRLEKSYPSFIYSHTAKHRREAYLHYFKDYLQRYNQSLSQAKTLEQETE